MAIKEKVASYSASFWRMMTQDEWNYLLNSRSYSHRRYDFAVVSGVNGVILYPDAYTPSAAGAPAVSSGDTVTADNWRKMQLQGCVSLPCNTWNSDAPGYKDADRTEAYYQGSTYQYNAYNGNQYLGVRTYYGDSNPSWTGVAFSYGYAVVRLCRTL